MAGYHLRWDLSVFGRCAAPPVWVARCIGGSFLLLCGACLGFSREPVRRGFVLFCLGVAVTAVSSAAGQPILFGILHCLGVGCMGWGRLRERVLPKLNGPWAAGSLLLWGLCLALTDRVTVSADWLFPLGLRSETFYSADYWPILPWTLLFPAGMWLGKRFPRRTPRAETGAVLRLLTWPGRHSLPIYLLHQPILYGLCRLLFG